MATWDVNQLYEFQKWLTNKNQAGGISAKDFFYSWNSEQSSYHEDLLGRWQNRNNGKTGQNTGLIQDQTILTKLAPFTIPVVLTVTAGFAPWPTDFIYAAALRINGAKVTHFSKDERWSIDDSVIDPPNISDNCYYFTEYANQYLFLPTSVTTANLDYIAACTDVVWAFTLDGSNRQEYDSTNSVQPKWNANTVIEITKRTLKGLGVHFTSQDFTQYGNSNIQTGD